MNFELGPGLLPLTNGDAVNAQAAQVPCHSVAAGAPADLSRPCLLAVFRSDKAPPFGQMAGHWFGQANPGQQAAMLTHLISSMGPGLRSSLLGGAGGIGLAVVVGKLTKSGGTVSADQATQLTPDEVAQLASHAEQHEPGVIDRMSSLYAEHPGLMKAVGGAASTIALARGAESRPA